MPSVCRRIVVLLVVALLGVAGPLTAAVHAQSGGGAGDQQYEDPFGGDTGSGSGSSGRSGSRRRSDSGAQPLTQAPQSSGSGRRTSSSSGSGTSTPSTSGTTSAAASPQQSGQLPNTGLDARILVLAGVVLVVAGLGLRLRNAPERF